MEQQSYANHRRYVPGFHMLLASLLIIVFVLAIVIFVRTINGSTTSFYYSLALLVMSVSLMMMFWFVRQFPLSVQDRLIRTEENLRHIVLAGKPLDSRLTTAQIIALRFAPDEEFLSLVQQAASENMQPDDIKKAIKNWKADHHRA